MTRIEERVWKFGDNISADDGIIRHSRVPDLGTFDISALKAMCSTMLRPDLRPGDIIIWRASSLVGALRTRLRKE